MKKNEMTWAEMLIEAVGLVSAVIYLGLQIYYGILYDVSLTSIFMNIATMLLIYAALTMLSIYPEWVNGLSIEVCSGDIRKYTIRMVRIVKLIFIESILLTSIVDVMGMMLPSWYMVVVILLVVAVAVFYEYRIMKILRQRHKK